MVYAIVSLEILSVIISAIILYGCLFEVRSAKQRSKVLEACIYTNIFALLIDILSWVLSGNRDLSLVIFVLDLGTFLLGYVLQVLFIDFLIRYLQEKIVISELYIRIPAYLCGGNILVMTVLSVMGKIFTVKDGYFEAGDWFWTSQIFIVVSMLYIVFLIVKHTKTLGMHDTVAMFAYFVAPVLSLFVHMLVPEVTVSFVAVAISFLVIYIMLQSEQEREFREKERMLQGEAVTDTLTELLNRKAYELKKEKLLSAPKTGVIFADVNGLKYQNDKYGHEAGDRLLVTFAQILRKFFREEDVFRISGDEFVVLSTLDEQEFFGRVSALDKAIKDRDVPIACIGSDYGKGQNLVALIRKSESKMYEAKEEFYKEFKDYKRS